MSALYSVDAFAQEQKSEARIVVVETVYHQPGSGQPVGFESRYVRQCSDEQPYHRTYSLSQDWQPISFGWNAVPGMVLLSVPQPTRNTVPSASEVEDGATWAVELAVQSPGGELVRVARIRPGESARLEFVPGVFLLARRLAGDLRLQLVSLPS